MKFFVSRVGCAGRPPILKSLVEKFFSWSIPIKKDADYNTLKPVDPHNSGYIPTFLKDMSVTILFRSLFLIDIAFADLFLKNICRYFWWCLLDEIRTFFEQNS